MRKKRRNGGFTLAELLIVVAIIGVLSGVAFVAVQRHQRSLELLERDTVAKEIFIAAQNHLTMAKAQNYNTNLSEQDEDSYKGYFGDKITGYKAVDSETVVDGVRYLIGGKGETNSGNMLEVMLPFGSIDDTIRAGGNYMIVYQPKAGVVLEVFFWENNGGKFDGSAGYDSLMRTDNPFRGIENKNNRLNNKPVIGWFGGEGVVDTGEFLETPSIEVINAEKLYVKVTDNNIGKTELEPMLKLILTGKTSEARLAFTLTKVDASTGTWMGRLTPSDTVPSRLQIPNVSGAVVTYEIVLDDITTKDMRFAQLNQLSDSVADAVLKHTWDTTKKDNPQFIPGEDIVIQAVAYSNKYLTSVAYSGEWTVNSLFGELREGTETGKNVAIVSNIRHLENLDEKVSALDNRSNARFARAEQTVDLDWDDFAEKTKIGETLPSIYSYMNETGDAGTYITKPGCYMPVSPSYPLTYNGQSAVTDEAGNTIMVNHGVSNIAVDSDYSDFTPPTGTTAAAISAGGMFGSLAANSSVSNLELVDFGVNLTSANSTAGALAGTINNTTVTNVVAYNSSGITGETDNRKISASGAAGGLIGSMTASSDAYKVEKSAAALIVESTDGNAGGLIGTSSGGTVSACYSAGHTIDKKDSEDNVIGILYDKTNFNVTAAGYAGGLIGDAKTTEVKNSYSTCSAKGVTATGGLLGNTTAENGKIVSCYATGLVYESKNEGAKEGALVGSLTNENALKNCKYFEIINEREDETNGGYMYLGPVGNKADYTISEETVIAIDASADQYNQFVDEPSTWTSAVTYDGKTTETTDDDWLDIYYDAMFNLQNIKRLGGNILETQKEETTDGITTTTPADFVATHYGDWPAPEIFVQNTKN